MEPEEELWHELVLAGVGGRTIAEAKQNLSYVEAMEWMRYRMQTGPLNLGLRLEHGFAMLATLLNNVHGGKAKFEDYLPDRGFQTDETEPREATPQDLLALLQRVKG
ncbi:phage tail assembly protein T [Pseudomonas protegens]|uniref:phage tail assembly protein T n=1 Tax=Pseudomonas protegens TaxID=380021 RepID=UPI004046F6A4